MTWKRKLISIGMKLSLSLAAVVLAIAAGECIVRAVYPEYGIPVFTTKLFTEFDPLLGWRKIPNFRGTHVQDEYTIVEQFNSKGLRGPEYPYKKPKGEYRILVLGDSFCEGYTVEYQDLFSEILKQKLNDAGETRIAVINAGTGGYSTDQELLFFQTEGKKYDPDLVIVLYFANDAPMNVRPYYSTWHRGQKPLFELVDGKLSLKSKPEKTWDREELAERDLQKNEHEYKRGFILTDLETWYLYRLYQHVTSRGTENVIHELPIDQATERAGDAEQARSSGAGYRGREQEWIMTEALMAELKKEASSIGSEFLLFYVPVKNEVYSRKNRTSSIEYNLRVLSDRRGIRFIPALKTFQKQAEILKAIGKRLYWKKDSHWTPEGHHLTGLILAEYILENREELGASRNSGLQEKDRHYRQRPTSANRPHPR